MAAIDRGTGWILIFFGDRLVAQGEDALPAAAFVTFIVIAMGAADR